MPDGEKASDNDENACEKKDFKEYLDIRNEMTAWFQRLTLTYNFCLLALVALLGSEIIVLNNKNEPALFLVTIMVLIVSAGGARMMGRIYTVIFRAGSYLRIYYKDIAKWVDNSRAFWNLHDKEPVSPKLRWVKDGAEVRIMVGILGGLGVISIIILYMGISGVNCKNFFSAFLAYPSGSISLLLVIFIWGHSLYRLWVIKKHKKLWEDGWQKFRIARTKHE